MIIKKKEKKKEGILCLHRLSILAKTLKQFTVTNIQKQIKYNIFLQHCIIFIIEFLHLVALYLIYLKYIQKKVCEKNFSVQGAPGCRKFE